MLFHTLPYLAFLAVSVLLYRMAMRRHGARGAMIVLLAASFFFYGFWDVRGLPLLGGSIVFNYLCGNLLQRDRNRRMILLAGLAVNILLLGFFKYTNFFLGSIAPMTGVQMPLMRIVLPLGISFFTFRQIAWLVENARGSPRYNFLEYAAFMSFFPHLIAGPITHHDDLIPQMRAASKMLWEDVSVGLTFFTFGLAKKVLIADMIATTVDPVFSAAARGTIPTFLEAWAVALGYGLQLYFDFSGYMDMAMGSARFFGLRLPLNFDAPYRATGIIDFWQRWHVTLGRFLRNYIYIPLGGNRRGRLRQHLNLLITMLIAGLWHGAGWTFVAWGGVHGILLVVNHQWRAMRESIEFAKSIPLWMRRAVSRFVTFGAVTVLWVLFRADTFSTSVNMYRGMMADGGIALRGALIVNAGEWKAIAPLMLAGILIAWFAPTTQSLLRDQSPALHWIPGNGRLRWSPTIGWAVSLAAMFVVAFAAHLLAGDTEFLYFRF